jgi:hypothetical protein
MKDIETKKADIFLILLVCLFITRLSKVCILPDQYSFPAREFRPSDRPPAGNAGSRKGPSQGDSWPWTQTAEGGP